MPTSSPAVALDPLHDPSGEGLPAVHAAGFAMPEDFLGIKAGFGCGMRKHRNQKNRAYNYYTDQNFFHNIPPFHSLYLMVRFKV